MELTKWDDRWINLAKEIATWSKDPNKQVGAVIVSPDNRQATYGYNGLPRGIDASKLDSIYKTPAEYREAKNSLTVHAEANAVFNSTTDVGSGRVYVTKMPCSSCAVLLIQNQIQSVYCPTPDSDSSWYADNLKAAMLFQLAGIKLIYHKR